MIASRSHWPIAPSPRRPIAPSPRRPQLTLPGRDLILPTETGEIFTTTRRFYDFSGSKQPLPEFESLAGRAEVCRPITIDSGLPAFELAGEWASFAGDTSPLLWRVPGEKRLCLGPTVLPGFPQSSRANDRDESREAYDSSNPGAGISPGEADPLLIRMFPWSGLVRIGNVQRFLEAPTV